MKNSLILFLAIAVLVVFPVFGYCDNLSDIVENKGNNSSINWSRGTVAATGTGTPPERFFGKPRRGLLL